MQIETRKRYMVNMSPTFCRLFVDKASATHVRHVIFVDFGRFWSTFCQPKSTKIDQNRQTVDKKQSFCRHEVDKKRLKKDTCFPRPLCRSDVVCRHDVDQFWSILVDFLSILVDFCQFLSTFLSTSCRHKNLCRDTKSTQIFVST